MRLYIFTACLCLAGMVCPASNLEAQNIPLNPAVTVGRLPNGFTYYIRRNTTPPGRVTLYLANKVGSILESDRQQGLAHFLEHMSFNGTTHFPKNELIEYLQKSGIRFGADLNAYTNFDETVYQLPLPTDDPVLLKNGLQIMRDWAQGATLDSVEIEKERGVVLEEKRLSLGVQERMQQKTFPIQLNHARYAQRLPIGTEEVITTFQHREIIDFYRDWYRPDLQALIVVGDIDVKKIESEIGRLFGDLKMPAVVKPRVTYEVPLTGVNQYLVASDAEFPYTAMEVTYKFKQGAVKTVQDYETMLLATVFNELAAERFAEMQQQPNPPTLGASTSTGPVLGGIGQLTIQTVARPGALETGFKAVWQVVEQIKRHGFTAEELSRAKQSILSAYQAGVREEASMESAAFATEYTRHFVAGQAAPGMASEYRYAQAYFKRLSLAMLNTYLPRHMTSVNRDIILLAPEQEKTNMPTAAAVEHWIKSFERADVRPTIIQKTENIPLIPSPPVSGNIIGQHEIPALGVTELTLSNGATVVLKPTSFKKDEVLFQATSAGGTSLYSDADYESAANAANIISASGAGSLSLLQLQRILATKRVGVTPYIEAYSEGIIGTSRTTDLETALQLTHLYITSPRMDTTVFNNIIEQSSIALQHRYTVPENIFADSAATILGDYQWRNTGPSLDKLKQIERQKVSRIYKERFSNAADFTFTFVGDFTVANLKPLLEKYIASLPARSTVEKARALPTHRKPGKIEKTIYAGQEPKAVVNLVFRGNYVFNEKNNMLLEALRELLSFRLTERLREMEGSVYSPSVSVQYRKNPEAHYTFTIHLGCAPQNVDQLIQSTREEINSLKAQHAPAIAIQKFVAEETRQLEILLTNNHFWLDYLVQQYADGENLTNVLTRRKLLDQLTPEDITSSARLYLDDSNLVQLLEMPQL